MCTLKNANILLKRDFFKIVIYLSMLYTKLYTFYLGVIHLWIMMGGYQTYVNKITGAQILRTYGYLWEFHKMKIPHQNTTRIKPHNSIIPQH